MIIAVAGKGGVGKSTVAALVIRYLIARGAKPVLAVDADPNSTLGDKLGLAVEQTVGDMRERMLKERDIAPAGTPKQRAVEYEIQQAIIEGPGCDLLVMGCGEGPGCYCAINNMLRTFLSTLAADYKHVVVDNEAGMEHLSRRTNDKVDLMLVVSDPTPTALKAAARVAELARQFEVVRGRIGLVLNRVDGAVDLESAGRVTGLEVIGCVPLDQEVSACELQGQSILAMAGNPGTMNAITGIMEGLGI